MDSQPFEDLKAFEQRLTEVVSAHRPSRIRRRRLIAVLALAIFIFWYLFPFPMSLWIQTAITIATIVIVITLVRGHQKSKVAPEVIATRSVLEKFNLSCDDAGRLILKAPRSRPPSTSETD